MVTRKKILEHLLTIVSADKDVSYVLSDISKIVCEYFKMRRCSIAVYNEEIDAFTINAVFDEKKTELNKGLIINAAGTFLDEFKTEKNPVTVNEIKNLTDKYYDFKLLVKEGIKYVHVRPIHINHKFIGTLNFGNDKEIKISESDDVFISSIVCITGIIIEKRNMLNEINLYSQKLVNKINDSAEWISKVSHELRTPLSSVLLNTELMSEGKYGPVNEKQKEILIKNIKNILKMKQQIKNLIIEAETTGED